MIRTCSAFVNGICRAEGHAPAAFHAAALVNLVRIRKLPDRIVVTGLKAGAAGNAFLRADLVYAVETVCSGVRFLLLIHGVSFVLLPFHFTMDRRAFHSHDLLGSIALRNPVGYATTMPEYWVFRIY